MVWAHMLAYVTGTVDQELLLRNEYLGAENRILRGQIKGRLLLSEGEKATLAEIAQRLGRKALEELAAVAKPDTLLAWYRKLIANKFDGSKFRQRVGRPRIDEEAERFVVQMAKENPGWGYDRIVGALANLGFLLPDQTVGNILRRHGLCLPRIVSVALNAHPCGTLIADLIDELATLLAVALGGLAVYGSPRRVPPSAESPFC
jgi:putative transposase